MKLCPDCDTEKGLEDFYRAGSLRDGRPAYRPRCKACDKVKTAAWREANPERRAEHLAQWRENRDQWRRDNPALAALSQRAKLLASQDGRCAICHVVIDDHGHVDHDHETGAVRGVLCQKHNMAIGLLDDDPVLLRAAADYIERSR